jgi:CRISPR-associated protein Cse1 (CRISPR_cse1)/CRISPR-associated protein Cse2 (CRISPR_cse2)
VRFLFYAQFLRGDMNLIDQPWISTTCGLYGIKQALENAGRCHLNLAGMSYVSVLRLLLAICYAGEETSRGLLEMGAVSPDTLKKLEQHHDRFDLREGFWTCQDLNGQSISLNRLFAIVPTKSNRVFHVLARDDQPPVFSDDQLARSLLEYQLSALDFGASETGPRHHSPCSTRAITIAVGANLLETLALNLVPDDAAATPSWFCEPITERDCENQSRTLAMSIAERYSWVAQAVRFEGNHVITARGLKLSPLGDPMTTTISTKNGKVFAAKALRSSAWLTGCQALGMNAQPAAILEHASQLNLPHVIRVVAQINDASRAAVLVETLDRTFQKSALDVPLARQALVIHSRLLKEFDQDTASVFLSYIEDQIFDGDGVIDLKLVLQRVLQDVGRAPKVTSELDSWLDSQEIRSAFITYLQTLRPDQIKRIRAAWKTRIDRLEQAHPALFGWTRTQRLPRLVVAGVYALHPSGGSTTLISAIGTRLRETDIQPILAADLEHLADTLRIWSQWIPQDTAFNHARLLADLSSWEHPKRLVQRRWRQEYQRENHDH